MANRNGQLDMFFSCSACGDELGREDLAPILEQNSKTLLHAVCPKCSASSLILLSGGQRGITGMGIITDLSREEAKEKLKLRKITADEMIEVYKMMKI